MTPATLPISPLSLNPLTRDSWGSYDAAVIARIAHLAQEKCYRPKFYVAPSSTQQLLAAGQYVETGIKITPGSLFIGTLLPASPVTLLPPAFQVQITDTVLDHQFFDEAIPSVFLSNFKPTYEDPNVATCGTFLNLFDEVHPVTGSGLFKVQIYNDPSAAQRVQLVLVCLEGVK